MLNKLKNKKIKAFTMLELIIVIVIISVLIWISMRFGWDRINFLKHKVSQEQILDFYNSIYSRNLSTNYFEWKIYDKLNVSLVKWRPNFLYSYLFDDNILFSWSSFVEWWSYIIDDLKLNDKEVENIEIEMIPYNLWCKISWSDTSEATISTFVNSSKKYCFSIDSENCRLNSISCD